MSQHQVSEGFDPVLLAVISNGLDSIVREMSNTLLRTGRSSLLNTARDFSCSIVTADNQLLAAAQGLPIHIAGSHHLTEAMARLHPDLREGDAFLHNDPYDGNTHHADYNILVPVFHEGEHMFTAVALAHQADCGNSKPTTYTDYARDIYEEGALNFPCVRVQSAGVDEDDIIRMCRRRMRVPEVWYGDYLAMVGAARTGERRLRELLDKYGNALMRSFSAEWFDYSERRMIKAISKLPAGQVTGEGRHDPVQAMPDGIPIKVKVTIDPERARAEFDLRDNIDCMPNGFNLSEVCATSAVITALFNSLHESVPHNSGSFRRIEVKLRENCAVGIPRHPVSCSIATTNVAERLISISQLALADLGPKSGLAEGGVGMGPGMGVVSGSDHRRGDEPYVNQIFLTPVGGPASPYEDGWISFGVPVDGGLMYRDSVEVVESKYPILVNECRLLIDSEGAGTFRGAPGSRVSLTPLGDGLTVAYLTDGCVFPPRGANSGQAPMAHGTHVELEDGSRQEIPPVGQIELERGQRIVEEGAGGGGYGPASKRDPERVRVDVASGFVSVERARQVYGVVLRPDPESAREFAVDHQATDAVRRGETSSKEVHSE